MKGMVVYDTYFGNTKMVAEAIAEQIKADGHEAVLQSAREGMPQTLDADFMFIGSPTRIAKMTGKTKRFVKKLSKSSWGAKPICFFDTTGVGVEKATGRWSGTAAQKLHDLAREKGLNARDPVLHTEVKDVKGPLADDAVQKAKDFTHEVISSLGK